MIHTIPTAETEQQQIPRERGNRWFHSKQQLHKILFRWSNQGRWIAEIRKTHRREEKCI